MKSVLGICLKTTQQSLEELSKISTTVEDGRMRKGLISLIVEEKIQTFCPARVEEELAGFTPRNHRCVRTYECNSGWLR